MLKQHKELVRNLIKRIQNTEALIVKFPFFEKEIIQNSLTDNNDHLNFGNRYKDLYLAWGINRFYYSEGKREVTNMGEKHNGILWNVYVNTLELYDSHNKFGLFDLRKHVFFLDEINSTFYCTNEQIEKFLNALNSWYLSAREQVKIVIAQEKIKKLEDELVKLKVGIK